MNLIYIFTTAENFVSRMKSSFKNAKKPKVEKRANEEEKPDEILPKEEVGFSCSSSFLL